MKSMENRDAKGTIMMKLLEIPEAEKGRLISKYKTEEKLDSITDTRHRIFVGTWFNRAVKAAERGATDEEISRFIEVLFVACNMQKYNLELSKAIDDANLDALMEKYILQQRVVKDNAVEKRRRMLQMAEARRDIINENVKKLHDNGFTNREISMILEIPESAIIKGFSTEIYIEK